MPCRRRTSRWLHRRLSLLLLTRITQAVVPSGDPCGKNLLYSGNLTVSTAADVDAITRARCAKITCNLVVEKTFPGLATFPTISQVENAIRVGNDVRASAEDSSLTGLSFPNLTRANDIAIAAASGITTLDFPALEEADLLSLVNLPNLQKWTGFQRLKRANYVRLVNVGLSRVTWNSSDALPATVTSLYMANNTNLAEINLLDLRDVTGGTVEIHGNGATTILLAMESVRYFEVTGCTAFLPGLVDDGLYYLRNISGAREGDGYLRMYNNTFSAVKLPSLTTLNGSIEIHSNPSLTSASIPALQTVNGFLSITDNDRLKVINQSDLANLRYVSQGVNLTGTFEKINLPVDTRVRYAMIVASTANISCTPFDGAFLSGFYGRYACAPNGTPPVLARNRSGSDPSEGDSSGDGVGVLPRAAFLAICIIFPILGVIFWSCVIWWLISRRRRQRRQAEALKTQAQTWNGAPPPPSGAPLVLEGEKIPTGRDQGAIAPLPPQGTRPPFSDHHNASPAPIPEVETSSGVDPRARVGELDAGTDSISRLSELDARERTVAERERQRHEQELRGRERALGERERQIEAWEREQSMKGASELQ